MKFAFVTCVRLGLACMESIYGSGRELDLVVTLPDNVAPRKSGRVYLDRFCSSRRVELLKARNVNLPEVELTIRERGIDWLFIIGWSQIAKANILSAPRLGAIGAHPTLLPNGRGRASIPWAILKNLEKTGVTLFKLDEGVDTGPILDQKEIPIEAEETAATLYRKVERAHSELVAAALPALANGSAFFSPQDESRATFWPGRTPEDGRLRLDMQGEAAARLVRAVTRPYPGAFLDDRSRRLRVWAGRFHRGLAGREGFPTIENGRLWIPFQDGLFEALDWEDEGTVSS